MDNKPSDELVKRVLGVIPFEVKIILNEFKIYQTSEKFEMDTITVNIHEFINLCKEYAWAKYHVSISAYRHDFWVAKMIKHNDKKPEGSILNYSNNSSDTEVESVLKAANWLVDNIE